MSSLLLRGHNYPSYLRRRVRFLYHHKVLLYLLRDRRASLFWCFYSSGLISLSLEPCLLSQLVLLCFPSYFSKGRRHRIARMTGRAFFTVFFFPSRTSFWAVLYHNLSLSRSYSSRSRKGSNCCDSVSQVDRFCSNCRHLIFNPWGVRGLLSKSHHSSLALSSFLKNWWHAPFSSFILFLGFF